MVAMSNTKQRRRSAMAAAWRMTAWRAAIVAFALVGVRAAAAADACEQTGVWIDPATGAPVSVTEVIAQAAGRPVVLLGEEHDDADDHRWQLFVLAALYARHPNLMIGLEMLPRRKQPVLDSWVAGALSEAAFIEQSEWDALWGYDVRMYLPILHFARQYRIPLVALNVERSLVSRVGEVGWAAVPEEAREGVGDPAPAPEGYLDLLAGVYAVKQQLRAGTGDEIAEPDPAALSAIKAEPAFARFVEAQLTWDRAMAEAIATARGRAGAPLVAGLVGKAHAERGFGIPHQLADLGISEAEILLPVEQACTGLDADIADAVFVTGPAPKTRPGPRLGVLIDTAPAGVAVREVVAGSVAEAAGIEAGDVIARAAGVVVQTTTDLIKIVRRQAPGTWLPVSIRRDGADIELVAKFPPLSE
jgi:uncharacterized iron-regulated protein